MNTLEQKALTLKARKSGAINVYKLHKIYVDSVTPFCRREIDNLIRLDVFNIIHNSIYKEMYSTLKYEKYIRQKSFQSSKR
jgi:hypothetical protein